MRRGHHKLVSVSPRTGKRFRKHCCRLTQNFTRARRSRNMGFINARLSSRFVYTSRVVYSSFSSTPSGGDNCRSEWIVTDSLCFLLASRWGDGGHSAAFVATRLLVDRGHKSISTNAAAILAGWERLARSGGSSTPLHLACMKGAPDYIIEALIHACPDACKVIYKPSQLLPHLLREWYVTQQAAFVSKILEKQERIKLQQPPTSNLGTSPVLPMHR